MSSKIRPGTRLRLCWCPGLVTLPHIPTTDLWQTHKGVGFLSPGALFAKVEGVYVAISSIPTQKATELLKRTGAGQFQSRCKKIPTGEPGPRLAKSKRSAKFAQKSRNQPPVHPSPRPLELTRQL
ncbi:uncharacterized protein CCOS01_07525 [Colletotrichum costaricense]|uniref:Uncharacterized protein n=1 Tax=Colletotrichum costaricense TaxID=1209916 RepID=A0AAI9YX65_9PEZI|nr:uncharacterized protein CCOS01_07525 [Colletotrichum costaricense]KAK1527263.1 hypothetical protein CCOS01_07525 [Colletotrichum costaricense]